MISPYPLSPLELATGQPVGLDERIETLPSIPDKLTAREAFADAIRPCLERSPCLVTFSGGRDSSAVLAVATRVAREEGLPLPVPISVRFADAPGSREAEWQELTIAHLGLSDWIRLELGDEIDYIGPHGQLLLLRHGLMHPAVLLLFSLQLERGGGASLLTGVGGDAVCGGWLRPHWAEVRAGRARAGREELTLAAYLLAPRAVRRAYATRLEIRPQWLREAAWRAHRRNQAEELASRPVAWDRYLLWHLRLRRMRSFAWSLAQVAAAADAVAAHPFEDPRFLAALSRAGGRRGFGDRTSVMRFLFEGDLPDALISRSTKGNFTLAYFRGATRAFARRWDGSGVDDELVDPERLREAWLRPVVNPRTALLLQSAWLDSVRRGVEQPLAEVVERRTASRPRGAPDR